VADVLIIRQNHVPVDPRVRRELLALLDAGYSVDVVCTKRRGEPVVERQDRLRIYRVPLYHRRGGVPGYLLEYLLFFSAAAALGTVLHLRRRYRVVQVNTLPDVLVFAAAIPRLLGARVLLDLQECMPEFFQTKFGVGPGHPAVRLLGALEQASIRFADAAVTCTEQMRAAFVRRGADPEAITVVLNAADEKAFDPNRYPDAATTDGFTLVCHGAVEERYGIDTVVRAVALLAAELPDLHLDIYGEGPYLPDAHALAKELGVGDRVWFSDGYVPLEELVSGIARADAGVVAMKRDAFRDLTQCNKMYDFIAMRKPVITSWTESVAAYFSEECFAWFTSDDEHELAVAIRTLYGDRALREKLVSEATAQAEPYRWVNQRDLYLTVVRRLLRR
jgi:glycosyltransferase involved in cell wall biosynthesis